MLVNVFFISLLFVFKNSFYKFVDGIFIFGSVWIVRLFVGFVSGFSVGDNFKVDFEEEVIIINDIM